MRYVIGMDSSTQSVKAVAWTPDGTPVAEGRAPHAISTPHPLKAEQNADDWWTAACAALQALTAQIDPGQVEGIAISNQRETMVLLDADDRPLAPATLWLDRRAKDTVRPFADDFGAERLHSITGKPIDVIPCVYRLKHCRDHAPELLAATRKIASVHDWLTLHLTGKTASSWTSADPFGLFDITSKTWSAELMDYLGLSLDLLPELYRPGSPVGRVTSAAAALTGLRAGTPVFAGGGDGQCAGLGVNVIAPGAVYLNLGTAVVGGGWSRTKALSRSWRTLVSPDGEGFLLEHCQRGGAYFVNWLLDAFAGGRGDPAIFARLEAEAAGLGVGSGGVMACSYLMGVMDPHWDENAKAAFVGLGPEVAMGHLYRAALEAITLEFTRSLSEMRASGVRAERIFVIGGGAQSHVWRQMVSDATGLPVIRSLSNEASALGAGIAAAVGAGWHDSFAAAAACMSRVAEEFLPDTAVARAWAELSGRQGLIYERLRDL